MSFLDNMGASFGNMTNDPRQMAMLMAAASMMTNSGPSNRPIGLGEIMGGGLSAYLGTKNAMTQQQAEAEEREQAQEYRQMQMQGMRQQQETAQQALVRAQALQAHMAKRRQGAPMQESLPAPQQGAVPTPMQSPMQPQATQQPHQESPYQRHMSMAEHLRAGGYEDEANQYEDRALKFAPKVKNWQEVRVGNSVLMAPFFEDGTEGKPMTLEVARKLEFRDGGGTNDAYDSYTGERKVSVRKTQSPDSIASTAVQIRGQNMVDARHAQEIAAGGKPPPGYRWTPNGTLSAIPGGPGDKLPEAQQKQVVGVNNLSNAITEYRDQLKGFGSIDFAKPDARAVMGTKYNNMMLQAKEAYNLGVLNGPDMEILQSVITDPRSARGVFTSKKALDMQASELDRIMRKVAQVSGTARQPQQGNVVDFGSLK